MISPTSIADDILVTEKDTFDLKVYYKREGGSLVILPGYEANPSPDSDDVKVLVVTMRLPDWRTSKVAVRNNTMFIGGQQVLDQTSFRQALVEMMAVSWNIVDADGSPVTLDMESLGRTRPEIMRYLVEMLERKLVEKGMYTSILNS